MAITWFFVEWRCVFIVSIFTLSARSAQTPADLSSANNADAILQRVMVRSSEFREFDWAKLEARARVAYVSSGPGTQSGRMIDNDLQTAFRFSASDTSPTVIVELPQSERLHRVSTVFKAENTRVDIYLLNGLPIDAGDLRFLKPSVTIVDLPENSGIATVDFSAGSARYVVLRWSRNKSQTPVEVAEISAFSNDPTGLLLLDVQLAAASGPNLPPTEPPLIPSLSR